MRKSNERSMVLTATLVVCCATGLIGGPATHAATTADPVIRGAHFSPTTPGVDVYLGSFSGGQTREWLSGVSYGAVSPYQRLAPGLYTVSMRLHGTASSTPAVLSWTLDAKPGQAYTVAGVGSGNSVRGVVIPDDLTPPPAGQGRVRVIQAASRAPMATVSATGGPFIARGARFGTTTAYATVPNGIWRVKAVGDSTPGVSTTASIDVSAGTVMSVLLLDAKTAGITLRSVLDSAGAGTVPVGAIPAGGGGTAVKPASVSGWPSLGDVAVLWTGLLIMLIGIRVTGLAARPRGRRRAGKATTTESLSVAPDGRRGGAAAAP